MSLASGATFGAYRIIEPLGRGGMASVYKAYEAALDRYVALKVLPGEFLHDETFAERFRREAKVVARLEHPNIIPIHAFGIEGGIPWMAMRLVPGGALSSLLRSGRLARERTIAILGGVADALDYAHGKGVVHRDVKPQNILLDEAERVYLADFGIAKMVEGTGALTQTGMITGTPQYMAPEQAIGQTIDQRVDIYATGVVAYEMLTGQVPFSADTPVAVLMKHVTEPIPVPAATEVPEPLVRALLKSMAKKPEDRWPTARAFVTALEQGLAEAPTADVPVSATTTVRAPAARPARTIPPPPRTAAARPPAPARSRVGLVLGGLGLAVVLGAAGVLALLRLGSKAEPTPASSLTSRATAESAVVVPPRPTAVPEPPSTVTPAPSVSEPPSATATTPPERSAAAPPPVILASPRANPYRVPTPAPSVAATHEPAPPTEPRAPSTAPPPPTTTLPPLPAGPTGTLQLDVDAQQDSYTSGVSTLYLKLIVDGRPFRDLSIVFAGRETSRSRKRQVFDVAGIPVGRRQITLLASATPGVEKDRPEGVAEVEIGPSGAKAAVQIRYNGVRFKDK